MILLAIILITLVFYYYWINRRLFQLARKIKGYRGYPLLGSAYKFLKPNKILDVIHEFDERIGSLGKFWLGNRLFVYVSDPAQIEAILNDPACIDKGESYNFIGDSLGLGLITSKSDQWRFHRKNINPCFSYNILNSYFPIFNKNLRILTKRLERHVGKGPFSIQTDIKSCSMDFICETTLGMNLQTQRNQNLDILHAADSILEVTAVRCFQPWIQPRPLFWLSKYYKPFLSSVAIVSEIVNKLFASKKEEFYKSKSSENLNDIIPEKNIFIDQLIKLALENNIFTEYDVKSEVKTMLFAGFETTATCCATLFALLAIHQDVQEKLFQEIQCTLATQEQEVTRDDIKNMPYLDAFIKESLRFFPTVPFITRIVKQEIKVEDVIIPEGTEFILDFGGLHRKQKYWKFDANVFNPDNFLPENVLNRHSYSYIPFSAGPRSCIGMKYADIALKLFIVYVLRQYKLTTKIKMEDLRFQMNITLTLLNENMFELLKRDAY